MPLSPRAEARLPPLGDQKTFLPLLRQAFARALSWSVTWNTTRHFPSMSRRKRLDNLLKFALEAHGGLRAWDKLQSLRANVSIGGALWDLKQLPDLFKNTHVELKLHYQHVVTHLVDLEELIVFTPNQVSLESESEKTLDTRVDPRSAFAGHSADSKWDKLHAGYFSSYALWGYLTTPFLYTYPGFDAREIDPWYEDGARWRVLQVTFPDGYAAHTRTQYSYFGEDGLLRRHLYTVDVLGGLRERIMPPSIAPRMARCYRPDGAFLPTTTLATKSPSQYSSLLTSARSTSRSRGRRSGSFKTHRDESNYVNQTDRSAPYALYAWRFATKESHRHGTANAHPSREPRKGPE